VEYDEVGTPIPDEAMPYWIRRHEVQDKLSELSELKCFFERVKASGDPLWGKMTNGAIDGAKSLYAYVSCVKPYAVCTQCQGSPSLQPKGCGLCGNSGLIDKGRWDRSPKEIKEMREKANQLQK
jgi:hypothetical protein